MLFSLKQKQIQLARCFAFCAAESTGATKSIEQLRIAGALRVFFVVN